ncbi:EEF1A lysine methyltransferase 1 isoform X3 [Pongo abelii]|uniref:EEF1A lysine methyltransferase 1 isoform X3 n=1 Tax=Pongo abelii TaxID=9601 RepID=UPI003006C4AD
MSDLEDDETPQLSAHALAALQEFYAEQKQQIEPGEDDKYNIGIIEENWQLSQFWYSQETALRLAQEAIAAVGEGGRIACVSAPSVYQKLRELCRENFSIYIFEYDKRFAMYGEEFIFYDYNNPLDLPERIAAHSFDIVIADPPYLSEECLRKTSETIKYLTRGKILLCTGQNQQPIWIPSRHLKPYHEPDAKEEILGGTRGPPGCSHVETDNKEDTSPGEQHSSGTATPLGPDQEVDTDGGRKSEEGGTTSYNK